MLQCPECGGNAPPMNEYRKQNEKGRYELVDNNYICDRCNSLWVIHRYMHLDGE
jgi:hypothetical protein